jgi:hypothetical protein
MLTCSYHLTWSLQLSCILEFDGACKGNPGKSGAGVIVRRPDGSLVCTTACTVLICFLSVQLPCPADEGCVLLFFNWRLLNYVRVWVLQHVTLLNTMHCSWAWDMLLRRDSSIFVLKAILKVSATRFVVIALLLCSLHSLPGNSHYITTCWAVQTDSS